MGGLSTRALDTLPQVIIDVCKENGIRPPKEMLDASQSQMHNWFQRIFTPVKKKVVDHVFADFIETSRQMANMPRPKKGRPMSIGKHCDWCQFEELCRAEMQGSDVKFIKEHEYEESDYGKEEEE